MDGKWKILLAGMCYGMVIQLFALPPGDHGQSQKKVHGSIPSYKRIVRQIRILKKYITEIEEELQKKSLTKKRSYSIGAVLAPEDNLKEESHPLTSEEEGSVNVDVPMPESQKKVHGSIPSYKRIVRQIRILKKNITKIEKELQKKSLIKKRNCSIGAVLVPEDNLEEESHPLTLGKDGSVNVDVPMLDEPIDIPQGENILADSETDDLETKIIYKERALPAGYGLEEESHPSTLEEEGSVNVDVPMPESQEKVHTNIPSWRRIAQQIRILRKHITKIGEELQEKSLTKKGNCSIEEESPPLTLEKEGNVSVKFPMLGEPIDIPQSEDILANSGADALGITKIICREESPPLTLEKESNISVKSSILGKPIDIPQSKDILANSGADALGITKAICKEESHPLVSKKEGNVNVKSPMLEPIGKGRFAPPPGYKVLNVPGDGLCGFWAVATAKKAKEVGGNASIRIERKEIFELLKRLSDQIAYVAKKGNKTDAEVAMMEEIDQLIRDRYARDYENLCERIKQGRMQLDTPLAIFLAQGIGYNIIIEWEGIKVGKRVHVREECKTEGARGTLMIYYSGNGSGGHYQAIVLTGVGAVFI